MAVQIDNIRGLLVIRRMDRQQNAWGLVVSVVEKGVDENVYEIVLRRFGLKWTYEREGMGRRSGGRQRKSGLLP